MHRHTPPQARTDTHRHAPPRTESVDNRVASAAAETGPKQKKQKQAKLFAYLLPTDQVTERGPY